MVQNYRDLLVWQKAMKLAKATYVLTASFPAEQKYTLVNQMQRAAISVPANIAEGRSRHTGNEFTYFLNIARGSLAELETYILLSTDLGYADTANAEQMLNDANEITKMLFGLRESLKKPRPSIPSKAETFNLQPVS